MHKSNLSWISLFIVAFLVACLYIFSEWLFFVTKPSYMNNLTFIQQIHVLVFTSLLFAGLCLFGLLPIVILNQIPPLKPYTYLFIQLGTWLPAVVLSASALLLVDNFTYTLFKFGIVSTDGWSRGLYGMSFILVIILCYRSVLKALANLSQRARIWGVAPKWILCLMVILFFLSVTVLGLPNQTTTLSNSTTDAGQTPHILLLTADGLDANHTSVYGYTRNTTPTLLGLAESALVAENAFSNSASTSGSVFSIYTGKYPAKTRVLYYPDILEGVDAYEHLPGILRSRGYKTVQITLPYYLDPDEFNLLNSFDEIKMSSTGQSKYLNAISKFLPNDHAFFIDASLNRIADRIRHIFFVKKMVNPYLEVTGTSGELVDLHRLAALKQIIRLTSQPTFVHVHFMVTHGEKFNPAMQKFSVGQVIEDQEPWNDDLYDDSILDFDKNIGALVDFLKDQGLLDKTILIIGSDHGQKWDQLKRLPLMFRFPYGQYAGRIQANVQNLDIPITILDFIGLEQPDWMSGNSLIAGKLEQRPIFGVNSVTAAEQQEVNGFWAINKKNVKEPFYQFSGITMVYCQKWYELDLDNISWESGNVEGSTSVCQPDSEITDEQAFLWIVDHLKANDFDVSTLDIIPK